MGVKRIGYVINVFPKLSETFIAIEIAELLKRDLEILIVSLRHPTETKGHDYNATTEANKCCDGGSCC